jgi:hypothetical protein
MIGGLNLTDVATYGYKNDRWNFVDGEAQSGIINKLNKEQNRYVINPVVSRVVWRTLPFYTGATLVRVTDLSWQPNGLTTYFLGFRGQYRRIDGSRQFISFLNTHIPLKLTPQNVVDYLKFYCFFVRYRSRPFILVETVDDIGECDPPLTDEQLSLIKSELHPISFEVHEGPEYILGAVLRYNDMLFEAKFKVLENGQVRMEDDQILGILLPVPTGPDAAPAWAA